LKKAITVFIVGILLFSFFVFGLSPNVYAFNYGDANKDGVINMGDVTKVERIILGLDAFSRLI
jgi:hypothetical protein